MAWQKTGNIRGPEGARGPAGIDGTTPTLAIGNVNTLTPGSAATAQISGTTNARILNLGIPAGTAGTNGTSPTLDIGTVTTLVPGSAATAILTGGQPARTLNLGIPAGATGATGPTGIAQIEYLDAIPVPGTTLTLGTATTDITITWPNPFPTNTYFIDKPQITVNSIALLGKIDAKIKTQSPTGATITITTTSLLSAGNTTISVIAYRKN